MGDFMILISDKTSTFWKSTCFKESYSILSRSRAGTKEGKLQNSPISGCNCKMPSSNFEIIVFFELFSSVTWWSKELETCHKYNDELLGNVKIMIIELELMILLGEKYITYNLCV